jgi:acyl-CoA synthetase (AMP-forming)/AMP-acid ligase II
VSTSAWRTFRKVGAIGVPGYLWEAKVVDDAFAELPTNAVGELAVRGPGVMKCYYKNPEATAEVLRGDWILTGDMARRDEEGFIFLVDRKKDVIITGGENLYPVEIETSCAAATSSRTSPSSACRTRRLGEIAAAVVELKDGGQATKRISTVLRGSAAL